MQKQGLGTRVVHADRLAGVEHRGLLQSIHTCVQYCYERVEDLIAVSHGMKKDRLSYPAKGLQPRYRWRRRLLSWSKVSVPLAFKGMAVLSAIFLTLLRAGDQLISRRYVFGNTNSMFGTLWQFGVDVTLVDVGSVDSVAAALTPNTCMVFVETIANPGTRIPDLEETGVRCNEKEVRFVVYNTVTSPVSFVPTSRKNTALLS